MGARRSGRISLTLAALFSCAAASPGAAAVSDLRADLASPPRQHRPSVFWWWPGTEVTARQTSIEIQALHDAGFGAAQIVDQEGGPVQGGGLTWQWGTRKWFETVATALAQGTESGVRIDGAQYPNWPMSSPITHDRRDLAAQALHSAHVDIRGPTRYSGPPPDAVAAVGGKTLVAVTAAQPVGGRGRVLDPHTAIDLTAKIDADGLLRWDVPPGPWKLFAFWRRPTGQVPQTMGGVLRSLTLDLLAPMPADQLVIDHFSPDATRAALDWIDEHTPAGTTEQRRANGSQLYEDSLELTVGPGSGLLWTPRLLREFRERRGYDLTPWLPVLFYPMQHSVFAPLELLALSGLEHAPVPLPGAGAEGSPDFGLPGGLDTRVRYDYYRTLTDLFIEHLRVLDRWRRIRGYAGFRHQAYGTTIDSSRAQAALGIPDTETLEAGSPHPPGSAGSQGALDFYRIASGAAHVSGSPEVNVEAGDVFAFERCPKGICPFGQEPDDYWRIINHAYVGGATHVQIHGLSYREIPDPPRTSSWLGPQTWQWPGWSGMFNAFTEPWNHHWPQWRFWPAFTRYMARASQVLSRGRPRVDLLMYRDDFLNGVSGHPPTTRRQELIRAGYTYDFADPLTLAARGRVRRGRLFPDAAAYKALVVDLEANAWMRGMPGEAAVAIDRFARRGLPVVLVGEVPRIGTSAADPALEDRRVRSAMRRLMRRRSARHVHDARDVREALEDLGVRPDAALSTPSLVHAVHRRTAREDLFYVYNEDDEPAALTATLAARGAPSVLDLWDNRVEHLAVFRQRGARLEVPLRLDPHEARVIVVDRTRRAVSGRRVRETRLAGALEPARWRLLIEEFSPAGPRRHDLTLPRLADWQEVPELRDVAGTAWYSTTLEVPAAWLARGREVDLDLGVVHGASRATINGRLVTASTIRLPGERHRVTSLLRPGENTLEVELATPPLNAMRGRALAGDPGYALFLALPANPAGMIGPVRLLPVHTTILPRRR